MKLQQELSDIKCKLMNEETIKKNLNMLLKQKNEKNEQLKSEIVRFLEIFDQTYEEIKWNKDKICQKDIQVKIYKEKLNKLTVENEDNLKTIEKLRKIKNVPEPKREENTDEVMIPLQPKPLLFLNL